MSTLQERLKQATGDGEPDYNGLAKECGTSRQAVMKWFGIGGVTKDLRMEHLFKVARFFSVDPEWLGTGTGEKKSGKTKDSAAEIPRNRIALIQAYGRLPKELRFHIRGQIEIMDALLNEKYQQWSHVQGLKTELKNAQETLLRKSVEAERGALKKKPLKEKI